MNNFDIKKYLIEGRLFEEKDPTGLTTKFFQYNPLVDFGGLRNQVRFLTFSDLPNKDFEAAKQHLIDQGYEIDEDQSDKEFEEDDDRYIYPRIIFRSKKIKENQTDDPRIDDSKFGPSPREFAELRAQMGDEALLDKIQMINVNTLSELLDELDLVRENQTHNPVVAKGGGIEITQDEMDKLHKDGKVKLKDGSILVFPKKPVNEASKRYGEKFPMDKFKSLKGKKILISGFPYEVLSSDEYGLEVKGENGNIRKINYNMFTQMGYVREVINNLKKKLQEKKVKQDPDIKGRKGTQPAKYYKGLSKSTKLKRAKQFEKQTKKSEDDPSAYKKAPGDTAKTKPSKYTQKFKEKFGEDILKEESRVDKSLKSKAKKANAPLSALRAIYNKGVAAWRTGHRPGATKEQWGLARVNSVLTGGKARKVDKVQWKQIQDYRKKKKK